MDKAFSLDIVSESGLSHSRRVVCRLNHLVAANARLAVLVTVAVHRERQPLQKGAVNARWVAEVDGRAENKHISLSRPFKDRTQLVADDTHAVRRQSAGKSSNATPSCSAGIISSGLMEAYSERSKAGDARRQDEAVAKMVEEHGAMLKKILDKLSEADTPAQ